MGGKLYQTSSKAGHSIIQYDNESEIDYIYGDFKVISLDYLDLLKKISK